MPKVEFNAKIDSNPDIENGYFLTLAETGNQQTPFNTPQALLNYIRRETFKAKAFTSAVNIEGYGGISTLGIGISCGIIFNEPLVGLTSLILGVTGLARNIYNYNTAVYLEERAAALRKERDMKLGFKEVSTDPKILVDTSPQI